MYNRLLNLKSFLKRKSILLLDSRQTGKRTLVRSLGDYVAVGVKAKRSISPKDERSLSALAEDLRLKRRKIVCLEERRRPDAFEIGNLPESRTPARSFNWSLDN